MRRKAGLEWMWTVCQATPLLHKCIQPLPITDAGIQTSVSVRAGLFKSLATSRRMACCNNRYPSTIGLLLTQVLPVFQTPSPDTPAPTGDSGGVPHRSSQISEFRHPAALALALVGDTIELKGVVDGSVRWPILWHGSFEPFPSNGLRN